MIILLSPAKSFSQANHPFETQPVFHQQAIKAAKKLSLLPVSQLSIQMKLSNSLAKKVFSYYQNFDLEKTCAIYAYNGYAFKFFDVNSFNKVSLNYLKTHLYILSGLYGLVRPYDAISFYRLEMQNKSIGNLYSFWRDRINSYLNKMHPSELIINLTSSEYSKVLNNTHNLLTIRFFQMSGAVLKAGSMEAKKMRGLMARYFIMNEVKTAQEIKQILLNNYQYSEKDSSDDCYVFIKREIW